MSQQEDEQEFTDILLLLISIKCLVSLQKCIELVKTYTNDKQALGLDYSLIGKLCHTLNLLLMLASSLLILLISASLLLQFLMSEMKTASPRMPSPRTAGIFIYLHKLKEKRDVKSYPVTTRYVNVPWSCQSHTQAFERFTELKLTELSHNKWNKESQR